MPIPPGISTHDWIQYINSYIDIRARQIYDKLKEAGKVDGVSKVKYVPESEGGRTIGNLNVEGGSEPGITPIKVPVVDVQATDQSEFIAPKKVMTISGVGPDGKSVDVFCEAGVEEIQNEIKLKDVETGKTYKVFIQNGELVSDEVL